VQDVCDVCGEVLKDDEGCDALDMNNKPLVLCEECTREESNEETNKEYEM